ncbi:MAG TPA: DUF1624 domain-containing protein [Candidatus Diapherotrites archaeon]|uniref:DUF1624 domain-containing protein n=1 Tax=Candidatus Iainarchaeum sp. TaxID=3101447 RepID=A0A7J4IXK4_9ARCH|nr:DUF1624 domain-containing protein [Candidatus Diapherotrites archaeon]
MTGQNRFWEVDALRGVAIVMMAIFHSLWDLVFLGVLQMDPYAGFWGLFQKATASLFIFVAGVSVALYTQSHPDGYRTGLLKHGLRIFPFALLVTAFTLIFFPEMPIYFGILHMIGASIILSIPFADKKMPAILAGIIICITAFINLQSFSIGPLWILGLSAPGPALDFFPLLPWIGMMLLGVGTGNYLYCTQKRNFSFRNSGDFEKRFSPLQFLGRNSLFIYLSHQFLVFPLAFLISWLI